MSKGVGFAGLGKHLAERTLGLLKGRKSRETDTRREDLRMTEENTTNYNKLTEWQRTQRNNSKRLRRLLYASVIITILLTVFIYMFL